MDHVDCTRAANPCKGRPTGHDDPIPPVPPPASLFADPTLPTGAKLIIRTIVAVWARARDHCWPSTRTMMRETGLSRGHVQTCLRALERAGYIRRERRAISFRDRTHVRRVIVLLWRLDPPAGAPGRDAPARQDAGAPARPQERRKREPESKTRSGAEERPRLRTPGPAPDATSRPIEVASAPTAPTAQGQPGPARAASGATSRRRGLLTSEDYLAFLGSDDPILRREAERLLAPPAPPPSPPATVEELLLRVRESPTFPAQAAQALAVEFGDQKSWKGFLARIGDSPPAALADAYRRASRPGVRNRGAVFMTVLKSASASP